MAIKRPDIYEHNNPNLAIVDSQFVRGGRRVAADRAELYALVSKADQLKENVTIVRVISDEVYGGAATNMLLVDASKIGEEAGWQLENPGGASVQTIAPVYTPATLTLEQSVPQDGEVGESLSNVLKATFAQGDAGQLLGLSIRKDGVRLGTIGTGSTITRTDNLVRALGQVTYQAFTDYAGGPRKNVVPINAPDIRPAQIRSKDAPQAPEVGFGSNLVVLRNSYRIFCGPSLDLITSSDAVRALPYNKLLTDPSELILNTGNQAYRFYVFLPPGATLRSVLDKNNCFAELVDNYEDIGTQLVQDAGGVAVEYRVRLYSNAIPYNKNCRHTIYVDWAGF